MSSFLPLQRKRRKEEDNTFLLRARKKENTASHGEREIAEKKDAAENIKENFFPRCSLHRATEGNGTAAFPKKRKRNPKCPFFPSRSPDQNGRESGGGAQLASACVFPTTVCVCIPPPFHRNTQALPNWICRIKRESKHYCNNSRCFPNVFPHFRTP